MCLLDFNADTQGLLDWVIDRCYTGANEVADGCFNALAAVFQTRSVETIFTYFTQCIYANGYIVFVFPFVCSLVCL